jgi:hypothetical protein
MIILKRSLNGKRMFLDKGYIGKNFHDDCLKKFGVELVCPPKGKEKQKTKTHILSDKNATDLYKHRNKIEHVNSIYRNFRAIDVRYNKKVNTYTNYLNLSTVLTAIMQLKNVMQTNGPKAQRPKGKGKGKGTRKRTSRV